MVQILVVGGGVAGTAVAIALQKAGFAATVFEAHASGGDDAGAFLTLAANGMLALAELDAAEVVAEAAFGLHTVQLRDAEGIVLGARGLPAARPDLPGYQCLRRADLYQVLQAEAERRGVRVERGKRLVRTQRSGGGIRAIFADGTSTVGELIVGADGLRSTVRTSIDPDAPAPRYVGVQVFYGYAAFIAPPGDIGVIHMVRGSSGAFGYTVSPQGDTWWFARLRGPEIHRSRIVETPPRRTLSRRRGSGCSSPTPTTSRRCRGGTGAEWSCSVTRPIPPLPASGQGASMALEDAVVLAKALRDIPDRARALAAFERLRRPRTEANVAASAALDTDRPPPPDGPVRAEPVAQTLNWATPLNP